MEIRSLALENYRNYEYLNLDFDSGINIIYGDNAQGKTNILEAVYMAGTTRSHRGAKDREMIRFDCEEAHIELLLNRKSMDHIIDIHLKRNQNKGAAVDKIPVKKAGDIYGTINYVFFSPEDLNIIKNGPAQRRRFIDSELCSFDRIYLHDLTRYHRIIEQRNKLLKDMTNEAEVVEMLNLWDVQMMDYGERIIRRRQQFLDTLEPIVRKVHDGLTGGKEEAGIIYEPDTGGYSMEEALKKYRDRDLRMRTTTVGPHRDDMKFTVNGIDARMYGSQGQQRTAALSLKLSEIKLIQEQIQDAPVLLLDDVLSELDGKRQEYLLDSLENIQTLITCTGLDDFVNHRLQMNRIIHVENGHAEVES